MMRYSRKPWIPCRANRDRRFTWGQTLAETCKGLTPGLHLGFARATFERISSARNGVTLLAFSIYDASIPMMVRMLQNLSSILDKAAAHATAKGIDPALMIEARLAPDMFNLARQVQSAADAAKACAARLSDEAPPSHPDTETSFGELKGRIAKVIAYVESFTPEQINAGGERSITIPTRGEPLVFKDGGAFLTQFAIPNFFFHVTTAYGLVRQQGVEIGKMTYLTGA